MMDEARKLDSVTRNHILAAVSTASGYDIVAALRGPDVSNASQAGAILKKITTGVIRHAVGCSPGIAGFVHSSEAAQLVWRFARPDQRRDAANLWRTMTHFRRHVELAFAALPELAHHARWVYGEMIMQNGAMKET
jgi:hypothetical protein